MKDERKYIFTSERLGFRNWNLMDIDQLHEINSDEKVMEFFPNIPTKEQTEEFIKRMINQFQDKGFCCFAVEKLENNEFIGFIGLSEQTCDADFTPCVDIGAWAYLKLILHVQNRCLTESFGFLTPHRQVVKCVSGYS